MFKKIIAWALLITVTATVAVGGTLAYLTDRDSEANVFTTGDVSIDLNEDFQQGSELIPGVTIEKIPTISNTGKNDAWVWATVAVPGSLDEVIDFLDQNVTEWDWNAVAPIEGVEIEGKKYTVLTALYKDVLAKDAETPALFTGVALDKSVDIDPEGNWYMVNAGVAKSLDWNNSNGYPVIYVSAYAIQTEGFNSVEEAYDAYQTQWGENGGEYAEPATMVTTVEEMRAALKNGNNVILGADLIVENLVGGSSYGDGFMVGKDAVIDLNGHSITMSPQNESGALFFVRNATLSIKGDGELLVNKANWVWASSNSVVNIEGGTWLNEVSTCEGMYVTSGQLNIFGGTFDHSRPNRTLNVQQKYLTADSLNVYGGTYVNCNPSEIADDGNLVEDGYKVISETQANGDVWYTVVAE